MNSGYFVCLSLELIELDTERLHPPVTSLLKESQLLLGVGQGGELEGELFPGGFLFESAFLQPGPEAPSRARRALPALRMSEKEDGRRPSEFLVQKIPS